MRGRFFLDTNIFVYTFDRASKSKRDKARNLVREALERGEGNISTQVIQEFLNVALTRFESPLSVPDARQFVASILLPLCSVYPDAELYADALSVYQSGGFSFYDSLIVAGAKRCGAKTLYSEDLQDGRVMDGLTVVNPFR